MLEKVFQRIFSEGYITERPKNQRKNNNTTKSVVEQKEFYFSRVFVFVVML